MSNEELNTAETAGVKGKKKLTAAIVGLAVLAGLGGAYAYHAQSYKDRFIPGTVINGRDVTGMTAAEALLCVKSLAEQYELTVSFPNGDTQTIGAEDMALTYVPDGGIEQQLSEQNPYLWGGKYIGLTHNSSVTDVCTFDAATLQQTVASFPAFQEGNYIPSEDARMVQKKNGRFWIRKEVYGTQLDLDAVLAGMGDAIDSRASEIAFDSSYYIPPILLEDNEQLIADMKKNNTLISSHISLLLHDGETVYELGKEELMDWLAVKQDNPDYYYVDEALLAKKAEEAAAELAELDDFKSNTYKLESTRRGTISFWTPEYGCTVDQEAEAAQLLSDVLSGEKVERTPVYTEEYEDPKGDTYVEVDIANQMVYMYVDGERILSSSCVSGKETDPERRSDRGFFHVTRRNYDYTMRGARDPETGQPEYESYVNYAVFYNGGEALHDASWRSSFGGSIYKYSGSHGCINLPYGAAQTIYRNSYVGMPVFVY